MFIIIRPVFPGVSLEIRRQETFNIIGQVLMGQINHRCSDTCDFEPISMSHYPAAHESAITPAHHSHFRFISHTHFNHLIHSVHDINIILTSPISAVGLPECGAVSG